MCVYAVYNRPIYMGSVCGTHARAFADAQPATLYLYNTQTRIERKREREARKNERRILVIEERLKRPFGRWIGCANSVALAYTVSPLYSRELFFQLVGRYKPL